MDSRKNILITGFPGVGKTTLIRKISDALKHLHPVGFYTAEIREGGIRKGFELISLDGRKRLLSHIDIESPYRVSKYGVDVKGFEDFLDSILFSDPATRLIIIDEIGKMECFSYKFTELLQELLDSEQIVIATIALKGRGIIAEVKKRPDIQLFEITQMNRETLLSNILQAVHNVTQ
jgi:nucleoside-triphosphatase